MYDSDCLAGVAWVGEDGIEAFSLQCVDFLFAEAVGDCNDLCIFQVGIGSYVGTDLCGVDIAGHKVYHNDVGKEFLGKSSRVEAVMCRPDFVTFFLAEGIGEVFG